jgi:TPR repeat protein
MNKLAFARFHQFVIIFLIIFSTSAYSDTKENLMSISPKILEKRAEQGDAKAQFYLGLKYIKGKGVQKNEAIAVRWWLKAAEQGIAEAQVNVARHYLRGQGVEKNPVGRSKSPSNGHFKIPHPDVRLMVL